MGLPCRERGQPAYQKGRDDMTIQEESLQKHLEWKGKIEVISRVPVSTRKDLSLCYTPGVAQACLEIQKDAEKSYTLTRRANLVAVITDGTAVLGLGDIGPEAGMPVMEGKCTLFKTFADVDAFPLCIRSKDVDETVRIIASLAGSFGGINLEDIAAPRCFEIERRLKEICDIPVFHDDQHGTAVVVAAALMNALNLTNRRIDSTRVVINGTGSAGIAIGLHLMNMGVKHLTMVDRFGIIEDGMEELNEAQQRIARLTNREHLRGKLADALRGADVFIGVSAPGVLTGEMIQTMSKDPVVFAMANPIPEIMPDEALKAGAAVVGTGRSDFNNQINNVLAFPGIFRGALDCRASCINEEMKVAATRALSDLVGDALSPKCIIPDPLDPRCARAVADAVIQAARQTGVARQ